MNDFFKCSFEEETDILRVYPIITFESSDKRINLSENSDCGELLFPIIRTVQGEPSFIDKKDIAYLIFFLRHLVKFQPPHSLRDSSGQRKIGEEVKNLPISSLEKSLREWVLSFKSDSEVSALSSTYALITCELINFFIGVEHYEDRKYFRMNVFDTRSVRGFWDEETCVGLKFIDDKSFKGVFSKRMNRSIFRGQVPADGRILKYRKLVLNPNDQFYFIPKQCYRSFGTRETFREKYLYSHFHVNSDLKREFQFMPEPYLTGALVKNLEETNDNRLLKVYVGDIPIRWLTHSLESSSTGYIQHPVLRMV